MRDLAQTYWKVGDRVFYRKVAALAHAGHDLARITFHHHEAGFGAANWLEEPADSWPVLLALRARQLREKYGYLRLWYSGGVDSHTALVTFLENQIPLDEICCMRVSPVADYADPGNAEINAVALPYLKQVEHRLRGTRVSVIDLGPAEYERHFADEYWLEKYNSLSFRLSYLGAVLDRRPELIGPPPGARGPLANIMGGNKPRLEKVAGRYRAFYWDESLREDLTELVKDSLEEFYFSSEFPALHIKQCHLVKNHLRAKYPHWSELRPFFLNDNPLHVAELNGLVRYPAPFPISLGKSSNSILTPKAQRQLFQAQLANRRIFDAYWGGISRLGTLPAHLFNNQNVVHGMVGIRTAGHDLGP